MLQTLRSIRVLFNREGEHRPEGRCANGRSGGQTLLRRLPPIPDRDGECQVRPGR